MFIFLYLIKLASSSVGMANLFSKNPHSHSSSAWVKNLFFNVGQNRRGCPYNNHLSVSISTSFVFLLHYTLGHRKIITRLELFATTTTIIIWHLNGSKLLVKFATTINICRLIFHVLRSTPNFITPSGDDYDKRSWHLTELDWAVHTRGSCKFLH